MNSAKKPTATASKFSGLLHNARTREETDIIENEPRLESSHNSQANDSRSDIAVEQVESSTEQLERLNSTPARRARGKRSDPDFTQITVYIRVETHQQVKAELMRKAVERAKLGERGAKPQEISEVVEDILKEWLNKQNAE